MAEVLHATGFAALPRRTAGLTGWLRRFAKLSVSAESLLRLESRLNLGAKKSLVLVNCCGKRVLLAVSDSAITPVMEVDARRSSRTAKEKTPCR